PAGRARRGHQPAAVLRPRQRPDDRPSPGVPGGDRRSARVTQPCNTIVSRSSQICRTGSGGSGRKSRLPPVRYIALYPLLRSSCLSLANNFAALCQFEALPPIAVAFVDG